MKKRTAGLLIVLLLGLNACGQIAPKKGVRIYKTDYIEEYGDTLEVMFDNEWTLLSAEDKSPNPYNKL